MKTGLSLTDLAKEIERRSNAKRDFIAPATQLKMTVGDLSSDKPSVALAVANDRFPIKAVAHDQLAEYTGIPTPYYRRLREEAPELLATNVNRWLSDKNSKKDRRMVRTLDGNVRALLSDKYRPLENEQLAEAILPVLLKQDLIIMSSEITETRLYIKAVDRRIEKDVPTGRKIGDGSHVFFDTVSPAITISNSEVGMGALSIETSIYTKACTNLATIGTTLRKFHTGSRATLSDEVYALLTDETRRATDAATFGQVRDLVTAAFDELRFVDLTKKLEGAVEDRIEGDTVEVIELVGKRLNLLEGERQGILQRLIEGGDLTRYGLHSAVTNFAESVDSYDRATELERAGGRIIELPRNEWKEILAKAA